MDHEGRLPHPEPEGKYTFEEISPVGKRGLEITQQLIRAQRGLAKNLSPEQKDQAMEILDHAWMLSDAVKLAHAITEADFDTSPSFLHVLYEGDTPVGCGLVGIKTENGKHEVFENFFGILSDHARQGLATILLLKQHQKMRELGITEYEAHARNESALPLYQKLAESELPEEHVFNTEKLPFTEQEKQYVAHEHMSKLLVRLT